MQHRQLWLSYPVCASSYFSLPPDSVFTRLYPRDGVLWNLEWMGKSYNIPPFYWVSKAFLFYYTFDTAFPLVIYPSLGFNETQTSIYCFSLSKDNFILSLDDSLERGYDSGFICFLSRYALFWHICKFSDAWRKQTGQSWDFSKFVLFSDKKVRKDWPL